jgi:hypothetical protein
METTMSTPHWRLAIAAGALLVLTAASAGLVQAAPSSAPGTTASTAPAEFGPDQVRPIGERLRALRDRLDDGRFPRLRRHLVHATITILNRDGQLVTIQLDHGTVAGIGDGSVIISEAGNTSVTVATSADTKVRKDRAPSSLAAIEVGDEVIVRSIVEDGTATARVIVVPPPRPAADTDEAS